MPVGKEDEMNSPDRPSMEDNPLLFSSHAALLSPGGDREYGDEPCSYCQKRRFRRIGWVIQLLLLGINAVWAGFNATVRGEADRGLSATTVFSPAAEVVQYRKENWDLSVDRTTPYTKVPPDGTVDYEWDQISMGGKIGFLRIQKEDLDKIGETSVELADGSGYMVGLEVFHQLHCLNYIRKFLYNSTYNIREEDENVSPDDHIPHCIDSIRLSLQCQADLTLIPFKWVSGYLEPWPDFHTTHQCKNFEKIREWAAAEQPDLRGKLVHPELGVVTTDKALNASALPVHKGDVDFISG
ncbi:hypothetical protein ASPBRDRAFT_45903 [Aspergillus brasiliensis CBS 101740]|uniref:Tat pathway signal sequence n=1 Tax=Aspergillus brasiliensis (strain CBS 101740 / IMI 381727 / IBT 21946) TaxID=767769 RepID=A0A1L9UD24_ASPBC|nr:hypothetical protein ASPBRDRAFT_45903 [Aspergillus brasiliensis CBS 101740]